MTQHFKPPVPDRILAYLAERLDRPVTMREVAREIGTGEPYVYKIIHRLIAAGRLVRTEMCQGRGGGSVYAIPAAGTVA